jgi:NAD-dependent protein deacetylase/lipoamidase
MEADAGLVAEVAALLARARSALFVTGAGISADSGLPTYRGIGGLYEESATPEGMPIEDVLSGETLASQPALTWKYLQQIERACRGARPNRGHQVIRLIEERLQRSLVLTQNVDGFHRDAGSEDVIEIHGNLHALRCPACDWRDRVDDYATLAMPPRCPRCAEVIRPDVVLFGEALPVEEFGRLEEELTAGFDIVFSIGTTSVFPYIALPVLLARREGIPTVEINPGESEVSGLVDYRIRSRARDALQALWTAYQPLAPKITDVGH